MKLNEAVNNVILKIQRDTSYAEVIDWMVSMGATYRTDRDPNVLRWKSVSASCTYHSPKALVQRWVQNATNRLSRS